MALCAPARLLFVLALCAGLGLAPAQGLAAPLLAPWEKPAGNERDLHTVLRDLATQNAAIVAIQRELVSRPALGPEAGGEGEEDKAHRLFLLLREKGIADVERLDAIDRVQSLDPQTEVRRVRPNIIARYPGATGPGGRTLWIICHMHVAAPGPLELWAGSPWTLRVEGDTLYGRGVMDNAQSITAALLLFESLARQRITPPLNLGLVLHSQNSGFRHVLAERPDLFKPDDLLLVPDYGNPHGSVMGVAEKGLLWFKLTIRGEQGHAAGSPGKTSALVAGSRLILALAELAEQFAATDPLYAGSRAAITPTRAATDGDSLNAVAAAYSVYLDCRFTPPFTPDEVEQAIRRLGEELERATGVTVSLERLLAYPALPPTPVDSPVARALERAVTAQLPGVASVRPEGADVITSASFLRARGLPALSWAKIDPARRQAANESARISDHLDEARVFARMLFDPALTEPGS